MNRTRLLMIGVLALAVGFLVAAYVYRNLQNNSGANNEQEIDVIVAANDLQVGARVEEHDIRIIKIPASDLPAGAPRKRSDVIGHGVIIPITRGEFILPNKLAGENAGSGLPSLIPPGMRAVSVRVNEVVSVAGFVTPGTRVDVLLTGTPGGSGEEQTTTVLQNVAVLASGHTLERTSTGEAQNTPVITLLVSPDDAERLALASTEGHIQLALRNPLDTRADDVPSTSARSLYKAGVAPPNTEAAPVHHVVAVKKPAPQATTPPPPATMTVEIYQGDKKRESVNCTDSGCDTK
jgi:pilus assembly protein CpaB